MAKMRSPNYPAFSLEGAIDLTKKLYEREKRTAVPPVVVVKAWGYNSLSGPSKKRLSALRHYGLIEQSGEGAQITERALKIIVSPKDSQDRIRALQDAALEPTVFQEIHSKYPEASDDTLFTYLVIEKRFTEDAARRVIKSYRANIGFAKLSEIRYITPDELEPEEHREEEMLETQEKQYIETFSWPISKEVVVEVRFKGNHIKASHFERLREYLKLAEAAFSEEEEDAPAQGTPFPETGAED